MADLQAAILAVIKSDMTDENKAAVLATLQGGTAPVRSAGKASEAQTTMVGTPTQKVYNDVLIFSDADGYTGPTGKVGYKCGRCGAMTRSAKRSLRHGRGGHKSLTA
jgi:hypothetical protein